jgi:hypothetical protein
VQDIIVTAWVLLPPAAASCCCCLLLLLPPAAAASCCGCLLLLLPPAAAASATHSTHSNCTASEVQLLLSYAQLLQQAGKFSRTEQPCNSRQRQHTLHRRQVLCCFCGCESLLLHQLQQRCWPPQQRGNIAAVDSCSPQPERRHH